MNADADPAFAVDFDLNHGSIGQVLLEHHVNPVPGRETVLHMRDRYSAQPEVGRMVGYVEPRLSAWNTRPGCPVVQMDSSPHRN